MSVSVLKTAYHFNNNFYYHTQIDRSDRFILLVNAITFSTVVYIDKILRSGNVVYSIHRCKRAAAAQSALAVVFQGDHFFILLSWPTSSYFVYIFASCLAVAIKT